MLKIILSLLLTSIVVNLKQGECVQKLQEYFHWNVLDYTYPSSEERLNAIMQKKFIPENNLPVGIEVWKDKLFVTVPRWREGIPSTLNYISLDNSLYNNQSPTLTPYPNWKSNEAGNCQTGLTTVYRIKADKCDRLWVLDTGTFGIEETTERLCPFVLNVLDLNRNEIIRKYEIPKEYILETTFIANIAVDVGETCNEAFAYMSDELGYGLIVYSWEQNTSWRFSHGFFMPDPLAGNFNIDGLNFQWEKEGIFGMALSPQSNDGHRVLYFSPLASFREFAISTKVLKNQYNVNNSYFDFVALNERGCNSHITAKVMDEYGLEFFNLIDINAIGCWYSGFPYEVNHLGIVDRDDEGLIFPSDVKIDEGRNLWVISDRMSNFLIRGLDYSQINFRIFSASIDYLIKNTVCDYTHFILK